MQAAIKRWKNHTGCKLKDGKNMQTADFKMNKSYRQWMKRMKELKTQ